MSFRTAPLALAVLFALTACSGDDSASADSSIDTSPAVSIESEVPTELPSEAARVTISQSRFDQLELRVAPGTTVVFENTDAFAHTITSKDGSPIGFDSGELGQGETFEFTFDEPGEYSYFCQIHPTMRAVVIVE